MAEDDLQPPTPETPATKVAAMSAEQRSAYLRSLGCKVIESGESSQPLSIVGAQAPPEKSEPTPMEKSLQLLREAGIPVNTGGKSSQPLTIIGAKAPPPKREPMPMEEALQFLRGKGAINRGGEAITIIGARSPTKIDREWQTKEFKHHFEGMAKRAKDGDWYIIFEVDPADLERQPANRGVPGCFVQVWFSSD